MKMTNFLLAQKALINKIWNSNIKWKFSLCCFWIFFPKEMNEEAVVIKKELLNSKMKN